jgi:hypothetical protein
MDLFSNLFRVRKVKSYERRLSAMDSRLYESNDYRENMLVKSLSSYIQRNDNVNDFVILLQHVLADLVDSVTHLKMYKSFTVRKNDKKVK